MIFLDIFRWFGIIQAWWLYWVFFKRRTYYEDIPQGTRGRKHKNRRFKGGKLIISNHFSVVDYMLNMFIVLPRKLWVVASEHAYRNKLQGFGMMFFGGIPCDRRIRSMRFMERSVEVLRKGGLVQIFPEGKNTDDGLIGPFYPSYIVIAHRAGVPIVPILTDGSYGFRKRAHVLIGCEIHTGDYIKTEGPIIPREELMAANEAIREKVLTLKAELDARIEAEKSAKKSARRGKKARKDGT
jgi:1-acyl-sn-glycerol-3-phosphate acyltransferase